MIIVLQMKEKTFLFMWDFEWENLDHGKIFLSVDEMKNWKNSRDENEMFTKIFKFI